MPGEELLGAEANACAGGAAPSKPAHTSGPAPCCTFENQCNRPQRSRGTFCKRNIALLPWLGFSSSVYSRLLLQFRLEMFLTSPGMFKTSLDKVQDRGTST